MATSIVCRAQLAPQPPPPEERAQPPAAAQVPSDGEVKVRVWDTCRCAATFTPGRRGVRRGTCARHAASEQTTGAGEGAVHEWC